MAKTATDGAIPITITLDQYVTDNKVNAGTVASLKYEAQRNEALLAPKTKEEWDLAFKAQSNKIYE